MLNITFWSNCSNQRNPKPSQLWGGMALHRIRTTYYILIFIELLYKVPMCLSSPAYCSNAVWHAQIYLCGKLHETSWLFTKYWLVSCEHSAKSWSHRLAEYVSTFSLVVTSGDYWWHCRKKIWYVTCELDGFWLILSGKIYSVHVIWNLKNIPQPFHNFCPNILLFPAKHWARLKSEAEENTLPLFAPNCCYLLDFSLTLIVLILGENFWRNSDIRQL